MDILNELKYMFKSQYFKNMDEIERENTEQKQSEQIENTNNNVNV